MTTMATIVAHEARRASTILLLSYIEQDAVALRARIETGKSDDPDLSPAARLRIYSNELTERGY